MDWDSFQLPHIRYLSGDTNSPKTTELYYLGGEINKNLTIGQKYKLRQLLYAEKREDKRVKVWVCNDNDDKIIQINFNKFGDFSDLRDSKIKKIIK